MTTEQHSTEETFISFDELVQSIIDYKNSVDKTIAINSIHTTWDSLEWTNQFDPKCEHGTFLKLYCLFYPRITFAEKLKELLEKGFTRNKPNIVANCFDHFRHLGFICFLDEVDYNTKVFELAKRTGTTYILDVYETFIRQVLEKRALYRHEHFELQSTKVRLEVFRSQNKINDLVGYLSNCVPYDRGLLAKMSIVFTAIFDYVQNTNESHLYQHVAEMGNPDVHNTDRCILLAVLSAIRLKELEALRKNGSLSKKLAPAVSGGEKNVLIEEVHEN